MEKGTSKQRKNKTQAKIQKAEEKTAQKKSE